MSTEPGWYQAEGDPPDTTRYWNGAEWVGDPVATSGASITGSGSDLASPGIRIGARAIDLVILMVLSLIFLFPLIGDLIDNIDALPTDSSDSELQAAIEDAIEGRSGTLLLMSLAGFVWEWFFTAFAGGTPGKLLLGLRVTDQASGDPVSFGAAGVRTAVRALSVVGAIGVTAGNFATLAWVAIGLVSLIMLFNDDWHRTVMDRLARTIVTKR